ncbi:hypothetical protein AN958_00044 [Leucoagaricus sp. SymC.cos]|nr:hypothetical protein AN958_00044 [Leucoagaricus sp. SymC.cos]
MATDPMKSKMKNTRLRVGCDQPSHTTHSNIYSFKYSYIIETVPNVEPEFSHDLT